MKLLDIRRLGRACVHSMRGLREAFQKEAACQQELTLLIIGVPVAFFVDVGLPEKALLVSSLLFILVVELLNTAIETIVDMVSPERRPMAGYAKDLGSAAVFLSLVLAAVVWIGILAGRFIL